ncbi:META domain-containing protein [Glaciibacter superstes]|uniref:META domain-containing protein n=1 Tax=Glaciibacter superstes TaxID=501023 RepID=UPI00146D86A3|nr:META domain-containing protein [Glaciibacter superstes]
MHNDKRNTRRAGKLALLVGTAFLAAALLSGCTGPAGGTPSGTTGTPSAEPSSAITAEELVGTWVSDEALNSPKTPFLTIVDDGTWTASDGCNGVQGTWELGADGALTTTAGPHTLIFCEGKPIPSLFSEAKAAALEGTTLTLKDAAGEVTATLVAGNEDLTPVN